MCKKLVSVFLAAVCCLGLSAVSFAEAPESSPPSIETYLVSGNTVYSELTISGTEADLYSSVTGKSGTTKITITHVLQKKSGTRYSDVSGTKATKNVSKVQAAFETYNTVERGQTYRVKTTAKITGSGGTDTVTKYSKAVTCR